MENHPIFLSNFLSTILFVSSTIFGLRYRYIFFLNTSVYIAYQVYVIIQGYDPMSVAITQLPQLSTFYVIGLISAYVLELQKMKLFKNQYLLKKQVQTVEDLNQVKDRLFRTISHDIRGPILNLKGVTSLFRKGNISERELIMLISSLDGEVTKTSNLIDNLLAWSKSQLDGLEVSKSLYKISAQIGEAKETYKSLIKEKNIDFKIDIEEGDKIFADKEMMLIVFRNLISNAIKFTPIGGQIMVKGKVIPSERCYEIKISDTGVGIDSKKIIQLFAVSHERLIGDMHSSGAGLGLTLVKDFIDLNDGTIYCESKSGKGTIFTIRIPQPNPE